ncbi:MULTISPECIES: amidase [unclassified Haladaptatus]|uniref:amidase n=1 Tax=unclassified Haladaptatus TaxID=2622732 RepID=UPI0023E8E522|nr:MULTISPECIES: amidase family protein [unclassified Haladaptatus]
MTDLCFEPAASLARRIRAGDLSPVAVLNAHLDRIETRNERTNAYVHLAEAEAREAAREAEQAVSSGATVGPLHGLPIAVKDLLQTAGMQTTFGSKPLADVVPDADAIEVSRVKDAGGIVLGKTNTAEFGHVAITDNELFGSTGTPYAPEYTAGGSSGGSAAAVADGMAPLALGTDAGGSVRIPASCCGIFGLKPSFGRVAHRERPDGFLDAWPFVHSGPLTRTVEDAALAMDALSGPDPADPFSLPAREGSYLDALSQPVDDLTVAFSPTMEAFTVADEVRDIAHETAEKFEEAGMTVERADPAFGDIWEDVETAGRILFQARVAWVVAHSEEAFGVNLADHAEDLSPAFGAMAHLGKKHSVMALSEANAIRTKVVDAVERVFANYDLILTPTMGTPPFKRGIYGPEEIDGEEIDPYTGWYLTLPFNLTGHPAASVPAGVVDGRPVGMQVVGRRHRDDVVLAACRAFEQVASWHDHRPPK